MPTEPRPADEGWPIFPSLGQASLLGPALERLGSVLTELRGYQETLRSIDPQGQALEVARLRAEATAEVLAAQQNAAKAAEAATRTTEQLAAERAAWERERSNHEAATVQLRGHRQGQDSLSPNNSQARAAAAKAQADAADQRVANAEEVNRKGPNVQPKRRRQSTSSGSTSQTHSPRSRKRRYEPKPLSWSSIRPGPS